MRKIIMLLCLAAVTVGSCSKKKSGVCYCKYVSGDKKEFNLTSLNRDKAQDSCNILDRNANAFGGECKLK